ncbi:MAG: AAA family ATPase, partial [Nocardioidaceae bacterium]
MLEELRIASLGVIDEAELELGPGLTVVTGETGAGKTMVVTALGLLLGERADSGLVRHGAERSRVEGRVQAPEGSTVGGRAREAGAELDDGSLIVARTVSAGGRSRANVGGAAVPVGVMSELTAELIVVHGQSDQQQLLAPSAQRECLDRFAGAALEQALDRYRQTYARLESVRSELTELSTKARERAQEADHLRFGLAEIEAVDPQPAEDDDLEVEEQRLGNVDALLRGAEEARFVLSG